MCKHKKKPFHTESPFGNWLPALFQGGRPYSFASPPFDGFAIIV